MKRIYNNRRLDFDVGFLMSRRPRDGTERKPRDGTEGMPRDGTESRPRDGTESRPRDGTERRPPNRTERKPRDEIMLRNGSLVIRYNSRITKQPSDVRIHGRPCSKCRTPWWSEPAFGPVWERYVLLRMEN